MRRPAPFGNKEDKRGGGSIRRCPMGVMMLYMHSGSSEHSRKYAPWLWVLLAIFICRVIAQLSLTMFDIPFLPPFEAWHSGALPYTQLLVSQVLIIVLMTFVALRFSQGIVEAKRWLGISLLAPGSLYFSVMVVRLLIGITGISEIVWFNRPIPSFFHIVLAAFVLLVGHYHYTQSRKQKLHQSSKQI